MWEAIAIAVAEVIKFLCKWGMDNIDSNAERRKKRAEIEVKEIQNAKDSRSILLGITHYNNVK